MKSDFTEYLSKKPEVYVDFTADAIAEPSDPLRTVDMLKELPPAMAELYRDEKEVLKGGEVDPDVLSEVDRRYRRVVGHHREWRKYLHRPECEHLWSWLLEPQVRARCAVAAVKKKSGAQRKILAVVPKNTRWRKPDRTRDLGLFGGDTLTDVIAPEGLFVAQTDLENAFTYVEWPSWVWAY